MGKAFSNLYRSQRLAQSCRGLGLVCLLFAGCDHTVANSDPAQTGVAAETAEQDAAIREIPEGDVYESLYIAGTKVGHSVTRYQKITEQSQPLIKIAHTTRLSVRRFNESSDQEMEIQSVETPSGQLVRFATTIRASNGEPQSVRGLVKQGELALETTTAGKTQTSTLPWKSEFGGVFACEQSLRLRPMKPGEKRLISHLYPVLNVVSQAQLEAIDYETTKTPNGDLELLKIKIVEKLPGGQTIDAIAWCDRVGENLKVEQAGANQLSFRTTKQQALAEEGNKFDLGTGLIVKVSRALDDPHGTRRVVYRVRLKDGKPSEVFPSSLSQRVKLIDEHTAEITVLAVRPDSPREVPADLVKKPGEDDLSPNNYLQSDDPAVIALGRKAPTTPADAWSVARSLETLVKRSMTNKNFSQTLATAAETAKSLEGDCTEHAMLLAALLRTRQIPSRVCIGLVYFPAKKGFAYHMWTEAWIGDRWIPLDATLARGGIGGAHITLGHSNLKGADALTSFLPVAQVMGRLSIDVELVE